MPARNVLEVRRLTIVRDGTTILRDVDWRVTSGEHWVILGANGSGKTSLLAALTGYLMPTSGEITVLGRRYGESDWRELREKCATTAREYLLRGKLTNCVNRDFLPASGLRQAPKRD